MAQEKENRLATTSREQTSSLRDSSRVIREFLVEAGEVFGRAITSALTAIWIRELGGIDPAILEPVLRASLRSCKFFPTIAEVLEPINAAKKCDTQTSIEDSWQRLLAYIREWDWYFGLDSTASARRHPPDLSVEVDHAMRAAGGIEYIRCGSGEDRVWAKKRFVEDLSRTRQSDELAGLLTRQEFRAMLDTAKKGLPSA